MQMGRSKKLFYVLAGSMIVVIVGLGIGVIIQKRAVGQAELRNRIAFDEKKMILIEKKAGPITAQIPLLLQRADALNDEWQRERTRLFSDEAWPDIESFLGRIAKQSGFQLVAIEKGPVSDFESFRTHLFDIRMVGPMRNIPRWVELFYGQEYPVLVDRISAVTPEHQYDKVKIKATVRYFEPQDPEQIVTETMPMEPFTISLNYAKPTGADGSLYEDALARAKEQQKHLQKLHNELRETRRLEKRIQALTSLLETLRGIDTNKEINRQVILDNLSTLYLRVQKSPLGSIALMVDGTKVLFPEVNLDD